MLGVTPRATLTVGVMEDPSHESREVVSFNRSAAAPGIEVMVARDSPREWRAITDDYSLVLFKTWHGPVRNLGRMHYADPSVAFCMTPSEAMIARPDDGAGSFNVVNFRPQLMAELLAEFQRAGRPTFRTVMKPLSPADLGAFWRFFDTFLGKDYSALEMQSRLVELSELFARELFEGTRQRRAPAGPPLRGTARMRECLNEEGPHIDLDTLAKRAGLSRFQALRSFKHRYGLPPHAYQLCVRLGEARRLLGEGAPPAEVAALCGFADQSHFNRHFKRWVGVTPVQYARGRPSRPFEVLSRSDR